MCQGPLKVPLVLHKQRAPRVTVGIMQLYHQERYFEISGRLPSKPTNDSAYPMDPIGNHHGGHRLEPWGHTGSRWSHCRILLFPTNPRRPLPGPRECFPQSSISSGKRPIRKKNMKPPLELAMMEVSRTNILTFKSALDVYGYLFNPKP